MYHLFNLYRYEGRYEAFFSNPSVSISTDLTLSRKTFNQRFHFNIGGDRALFLQNRQQKCVILFRIIKYCICLQNAASSYRYKYNMSMIFTKC